MLLEIVIKSCNSQVKIRYHSCKKLGEIMVMQQVHKTLKTLILFTEKQKGPRQETHILDIPYIRSINRKRYQYIFESFIERKLNNFLLGRPLHI
jgi:hypothetical protein